MPLVMVREDAVYQCGQCGNVLNMRKGQLLPPCPRCGGQLEKSGEAPPPAGNSCCGS